MSLTSYSLDICVNLRAWELKTLWIVILIKSFSNYNANVLGKWKIKLPLTFSIKSSITSPPILDKQITALSSQSMFMFVLKAHHNLNDNILTAN